MAATCRRSGDVPRVLSVSEREEISRGLVRRPRCARSRGASAGRPSTISREVPHQGGWWGYRVLRADTPAWRRARRPKPCKLACEPRLRELIPEQISGWFARTSRKSGLGGCRRRRSMRASSSQARGLLRKELFTDAHPPHPAPREPHLGLSLTMQH